MRAQIEVDGEVLMGALPVGESQMFLSGADRERCEVTLARLKGIAERCVLVELKDADGLMTASGMGGLTATTPGSS